MEYKELIDCYFEELMRKSEAAKKKKSAPEYERQYDAPREELSYASADEIERLSWDTTARLCDTEEYDEEDGIDFTASTKTYDSVPVALTENKERNTYGLSESDIRFIAALCESSDGGEYNIDVEATVERINEAFSDNFGDVIIENTGDGFALIEDYVEEINEWLKNL